MFIELMRGFLNAVLKMFWGENGENLVATLTMVALMFVVTFAYQAITKHINHIKKITMIKIWRIAETVANS